MPPNILKQNHVCHPLMPKHFEAKSCLSSSDESRETHVIRCVVSAASRQIDHSVGSLTTSTKTKVMLVDYACLFGTAIKQQRLVAAATRKEGLPQEK
jgi:hypothetical protein